MLSFVDMGTYVCAHVCMHVQEILYIHVNVLSLSSTLYRWNARCRAHLAALTERVSQEITVYYCIFILLHALLTPTICKYKYKCSREEHEGLNRIYTY